MQAATKDTKDTKDIATYLSTETTLLKLVSFFIKK
jgi:hypothetical protein